MENVVAVVCMLYIVTVFAGLIAAVLKCSLR